MKKIDLKLLALVALVKKLEKQIQTEDDKNAIRNSTATYTHADYARIQLKNYTQSKYSDEDQQKIDDFIKKQGFKKITTVKENYSIEIVPSEKAIKEFDKMLELLTQSETKNIARVASQVKTKINKK